jgi:hypothetical protein
VKNTDQGGYRRGESEAVHPVKQATVARYQPARVFNAEPAFYRGFEQITCLARKRKDEGDESDSKTRPFSRYRRDHESGDQSGGEAANRSGPGFLGRDRRP